LLRRARRPGYWGTSIREMRLGQGLKAASSSVVIWSTVAAISRLTTLVPVKTWFDARLADHDEAGLVSGKFPGGVIQFLVGQLPAAEPLRDDVDAGVIQPLDHVRLAILLGHHRGVIRAVHLSAVQLLDGVQHGLRSRDRRVGRGVDDDIFQLGHASP
jgi:hypothetical protein